MYLLFIGTLSMGLMLGAFMSTTAFDISAYEGSKDAAVAQSDTYRLFVYAAQQRMNELPPPSSGVVTYYWNDIRVAAGLPNAMKNAQFPPNWKVVRTPSEWVVCAPMSETTYGRIASLVEQKGIVEVGNKKVLGVTDAASANNYAALCN